ncbi:MAG: RNase adapter RapZ [Eubacteriales bacterium]|nr:RNase adapter RapZ [Sarcina sp.]MBR2729456.1 RNase adapter RapZ [Lachnospiraceae bacterium]MDO4417660.1 RNase adapter RapZ [Eubacteriales bacterium]
MRFVVVTGMSGGGKATAIKILEDEGFYCVDNLPVRLIDKFMELVYKPGSNVDKVVLGLDVRADKPFVYVEEVLAALRSQGYSYEILFMDASDETLIRRYKETRRAHPCAPQGRVEDGIRKEREILRQIKSKADYVFDTSSLLVRELREELIRIFVDDEQYNSLIVSVMSFGFKNGIPQDADLVFDVRFLPNPFYIEDLKPLTGNDRPVRDYLLSFPQTGQFRTMLAEMIRFLLPYYVEEGKNQLVIAIGCTGGQHRSVTMANCLYEDLKGQGSYGLKLYHRDAKKKTRQDL